MGAGQAARARRPDPALDVLRLVGQHGTLTGQSQHGRKRAERPPAMGEVPEGNQAWHRLLAWWQGMVRQSICRPGSPCLRRRLGALAKFASFVVLAIIRSIPGFLVVRALRAQLRSVVPGLASRVAKWDRLPAALARRLAAGQKLQIDPGALPPFPPHPQHSRFDIRCVICNLWSGLYPLCTHMRTASFARSCRPLLPLVEPLPHAAGELSLY